MTNYMRKQFNIRNFKLEDVEKLEIQTYNIV